MAYEIKTAKLPSGKLTYHAAGSGKPVLYLHSAGGFTPSPPLQALRGQYSVVAPIVPGFDGTEPQPGLGSVRDYVGLLAEFAREHCGERFDVIGSSFGSWIGLWLAVINPAMVDHLILQVPAGFRFGGKGGLPADPEERFRALYTHPEKITAPAKPQEVLEGNQRTYARFAVDAVDEELSARLDEVQAVTLILLGTEDPVVPPEASAHLKRFIPQSQRVFVFDAAHAIEIDQPERVTRLWLEFLTRGQGFVLNRGSDAA